MKHGKTFGRLLFIATFLLCSLAPLVCMGIDKPVEGLENRIPAPRPQLWTSEGIGQPKTLNVHFLQELGAYFTDRFAFRQQMVTLDAEISAGIFHESSDESVILGEDGWLYFSDTLEDYMGENTLSPRQIHNIVTNLSLMREYAESRGARFVFTVAPNKNELYPEHMPKRYVKVSEQNNLSLLTAVLTDVPYVDLRSALAARNETLYHATDSHWNNRGACIAYNTLLDAVQRPHETYDSTSTHVEAVFRGDLETMLFPRAVKNRDDVVYETAFTYTMTSGKDVESIRVTTETPAQSGSLVMYRDSFGNALLPFMAQSFGKALFSKAVPYRMSLIDAAQADTVIVEIAQRNIPQLQRQTPSLPAPRRELPSDIPLRENAGVSVRISADADGYTRFSGSVPEGILDTDSSVMLRLETAGGRTEYEASLCSAEDTAYGFEALLPADSTTAGQTFSLSVIGKSAGQWICVATLDDVF